jgi:acetyltransferase-like isoleucine patch superfamily enzyme
MNMPVFKVLTKVKFFNSLPFSRKLQFLANIYFRIKCATLYKVVFKKIGGGCVVRTPLLLTYEHITLGDGVVIWDDARIEGVDRHGTQIFSPSIELGDNFSVQQRCHITFAGDLVIGKNTALTNDVMITDIDHEYFDLGVPIGKQPLLVKKTKIGENCFIGSGAKIQAGTTLGNHCIVGANAVVRGDFPDYCVIVGMPAKIVKRYNHESASWEKTDRLGVFL